ncbi:MAG: MG2 domain-containing protein [Brachymonas sp.]|nr:MG2 domain-containing protein [Brachymonas sp.]
MGWRRALQIAFIASLAAGDAALALKPVSITPQGEVARVREFVVKFDKPAVTAGNPGAPAPFALQCQGGSGASIPAHNSAWRNDKTWAASFEDHLPPDVRCTATSTAGFKSPQGEALPATTVQFKTGAPFIQHLMPGGGQIEEDQMFLARFNGSVDTASVAAHAVCEIEGLGERVPVEVVTGDPRNTIIESRGYKKEAEKTPDRFVLLRCKRTLPPEAKVVLRLGAYKGTSGSVNTNPQSWDYQVRPPLQASFSCERPNAQAPCMPIRPLTVSFSAPIPMQWAKQVVLQHGSTAIKPQFTPEEEKAATTEMVRFSGLLPEQATLRVVMPAGLVDDAQRKLDNASTFPLAVQTGPMPPLLKFAAAPFGVVERFAEGPNGPALLPLTVRKVEPALKVQALAPAGTVQDLNPKTDAEIIRWFKRVQAFDDGLISREKAWAEGVRTLPAPLPKPLKKEEDEEMGWRVPDKYVETRMVSLLNEEKSATRLQLPAPDAQDPRPFEVIGMPLQPGFHVIEAASPILGQNLLDTRHVSERTMYVRTSVLVTNLGVHFKRGRTDSLVWVTTLDTGKPVADAAVAISDKDGKLLASGKTDANGLWHHPQPLPRGEGYDNALFVSARHTDAKGVTDMAFVWSDWNRGMEPWRFNAYVNTSDQPDHVAHSVLDRSLLRAGETVSMKHFFRAETPKGLAAAQNHPHTMRLVHAGTDEKIEMPLTWRRTATGGHVAENQWEIPKTAKLGMYRIELVGKNHKGETTTYQSGNLRVEEFRLPTMRGSITPVDKPPLVALDTLPVQVQLAYINGGAASGLPVQVSASARKGSAWFNGFDGFSFTRTQRENYNDSDYEEETSDEEEGSPNGDKLLADRLPLTLDKDGTGTLTIEKLPKLEQPLDVLLEASYSDPNGEIQTLQSRQRIWPAAVVAGIKAEDWVSVRDVSRIQALALDVQGKPKSGVKMEVRAVLHTSVSSRKRLVGGFYAYDNQSSSKDLGVVCSGNTDNRGLLLCNADIKEPGEVELVASVADEAGRKAEASTSITVVREEELWWGGNNSDRMDVLPEKRDYQPGETAQLQVRMPFRQATALLTVEREGVIHSEIVQLSGQDPVISLKIQEDWGPNVYVSVLALRGRVYDVPWYSFFTWGFKSPVTWWRAWRESGKNYAPPTAMVDLSKPTFRFGMAPIRVGVEGRGLNIKVQADRESYQVRQQAQVTIEAKLPNGQPAANAEVALAAVDEALLELRGNSSWDLLRAMYADRAWGVETSTAQMEIVGRRHYGRKAVPAGGDGGQGNHTRELLDTLLLWNPNVQLDAQGKATITVPLNDALTSFRIVAVGSSGQDLFGTGHTNIRTTQDLQIISGLPPLVREGDQYRAQITLRNTTKKDMQVQVTPKASGIELKPQTVAIPAGGAHEMAWDVTAPPQLAFTPDQKIDWEIAAQDTAGSNASDALKFSQRIVPAVPVTVQQATLMQVDGSGNLNLAPPPQSLPVFGATAARGGVKVSLQPTLAAGLPGIRDWFLNYPYYCLEQRATKAVGLRDTAMWQSIMAELPNYLDADGLVTYFPPQEGYNSRGSDTLTAYLLAVTHEATTLDKRWALPAAQRDAMLAGLTKFVQGRIERKFWSPKPDRDVRKLTAIEALSRYGKAQPAMLTSIEITPNLWPTHAVIDWFNILQRMPNAPDRAQRLEEANQILRSRLSVQGVRMAFSNEKDDYWWWLMQNGDVNAARLILAVLNQPDWQGDMGALASGFIGRQKNGAWHTTTANLWGGLALEKFSAKFEATPVAGQTVLKLGSASETIDWSQVKPAATASSAPTGRFWFGAPPAAGMLTNNTAMLPWQNAPGGKPEALTLQQQGSGKPWATIQALAAVPLEKPLSAGYTIKKTITPVQEAVKGKVTRGDVWRIKLEITADADMTWVVVSDPVPGGATILGSGLGRDSSIATQGEQGGGGGWLAYVERAFEAWRAYYEYLPQGKTTIEYTVRLNNAGTFALPPTRVEALYAPEIFGVAPNDKVTVQLQAQ